jgi:pimeloyl-ACP methyl ester carboxylesterase
MNFNFPGIKEFRLSFLDLAIWLFPILTACSGRSGMGPEEVAYQEVKAEASRAHPENRYHILVPDNPDQSKGLPLVIVLDAHGDGRMAVNKFQNAVLNFPCLVAGSDLIRNNFAGFESAIKQLLDDIMKKYPVDQQQIIISGFSGGARMAYYFALHYPVRGVLMCGAGPGQEKPSCPVYAISGMGDFNFSEQYVHPSVGAFSDDRINSDYFHGIHEWPQPQQLSDALLLLFRDLPGLDPIRKKRSEDLIQAADSLANSGDQIMAWKALEKSAKLSLGSKGKNRALQQGEVLLKNSSFLESIRTLERDLNEEKRLQQEYYHRLLTADTGYWKNELNALNDQLTTSDNGLEGDHYLRIKGYIGILLYSVINQMIHSDPGNPRLKVMLDVYALAEPENPDVYYFKALHAYRSGDKESCMQDLSRSLKLGFTDRDKLKDEFPEEIVASALQ